MTRLAFVTLAALLLAGCAVGPDYLRPAAETPAKWRVDYPAAAQTADLRWWEQFDDPVLNELIAVALTENRDIRIAAARVDQFLGQLRTVDSQFYPQLGAGAGASRQQSTDRGPSPIPSTTANPYTLYQAQLGASWEIDLFGRIRRQSASANAQLLASAEARRGVILSVVTNVATGYVVLRALDRQLEITRATASNYADSVRLFRLRFQGGTVSQMELSQVESQYQQAAAAIPAIERQIAQQENLLSILLGRNPGPLVRGKAFAQLAVPGIPAGLPSDLLERRPDIREAEQLLIAANADIGAARALYFPTLSLTGTLGSASVALSGLFSGPAAVWSAAAALSAPIFTAGNIEGRVAAAEAVQRQALERYLKIVQNGFREVNDALVGTQKTREEAEAQGRRTAALRDYARLARLRYDNGFASYVDVLYAENELFAAELTEVATRSNAAAQLVGVYKAMGGGWVADADELTLPAQRSAR